MRRLRRALAKRCGLNHPNLARTRAIGEGDGRVFLAFERAQHGSLTEVAALEPLEPARAARLLEGVAAGVSALGRSGLGPWDLTPERVLVDQDHGARLMTVGVPPTLIRRAARDDRGRAGEPFDEVSTLGSILFTALTGTTPAADPPSPSRLRPDLSADVDSVVMRALAPDRAERFADAKALTHAFSVAAGTAPERERRRPLRRAPKPAPPKPRPKPSAAAAAEGPAASSRGHASPRKAAVAAALIGLSAAAGITVASSSQPDEAPSSLTRAGVTVDLPEGWREGRPDLAGTALRSPIAATPPDETRAGLVIGKLDSAAAAERIIGRSEGEATQVQLGDLYALRHQGLRPRPQLTGTGYVVPTGDGAVLILCHSPAGARAQLAACEAAAGTLVVRGAEQRGPLKVEGWEDRLAVVIAELRARREEARRRLAKAERPAGQALAAGALERSHERAAAGVERVAGLESTPSLAGLSGALAATADAYGRLANAAEESNRAAYRRAREAVVTQEKAVRAELDKLGAN
jgi:hypothetical protein